MHTGHHSLANKWRQKQVGYSRMSGHRTDHCKQDLLKLTQDARQMMGCAYNIIWRSSQYDGCRSLFVWLEMCNDKDMAQLELGVFSAHLQLVQELVCLWEEVERVDENHLDLQNSSRVCLSQHSIACQEYESAARVA